MHIKRTKICRYIREEISLAPLENFTTESDTDQQCTDQVPISMSSPFLLRKSTFVTQITQKLLCQNSIQTENR